MAAVMGAALSAPVFGQQFTPASYMGEIVGAKGLEIYVKANNGAAVIASLDPNRQINGRRVTGVDEPHVEVVGEIRGEHLTKGMAIRFRAKVQGGTRRRTVEPVKKLEVFTPDQATQFGLVAEGAGGDEEKGPDAAADYLVVGVITSARKNAITVEFPRSETKGSVSATLAEDSLVDVKVNQLIAPRGAQISVEGVQILGANQQPIKLLATNVQIQLPPPPPPKGAPGSGPAAGGNGPGAADPFHAGADDGGAADKPEPEKVLIPGEIIKLN
jgi:hypothetical protein